jgi:phosphoribosylamine---glycine ligase
VLTVTALGDPLRAARERAYAALESIRFDGMQFRRDIGHRALKGR